MKTQEFEISEDVLASFPEIEVAATRVRIEAPDKLVPIIKRLNHQRSSIEDELEGVDPITSLPEIAVWRTAYSHMGVKPSKYHSSIEALLRRVKKGNDLNVGLPIVDFYNLVSIMNKAPIGAYDAGKLGGKRLALRKAKSETDTFQPLGGPAEAFPLNPELVVYGSGTHVLCWGFNTRDSEIVCVDSETKDVLFFSEVTSKARQTPAVTITEISEMMAEVGSDVGPVVVFNVDHTSGHL